VIPGGLLVAVAVLLVLAGLGRIWRRRLLALFVASCCIGGAIMAVVPLVGRERSSKAIADQLRGQLRDGDLVFAYRCYPESLPVYLERAVGVAAYQGELAFGISHLSGEERQLRFPTAEEFKAIWDSQNRVYAVAPLNWSRRMATDGIAGARVLLETEGYALLSNERR
jgi:hypothetical protein